MSQYNESSFPQFQCVYLNSTYFECGKYVPFKVQEVYGSSSIKKLGVTQ